MAASHFHMSVLKVRDLNVDDVSVLLLLLLSVTMEITFFIPYTISSIVRAVRAAEYFLH